MSIRYSTAEADALSINVEDCILHPKRRRIKHLTGVYLRNLATDLNDEAHKRRRSSATVPTTPTKHRRDTKEQIIGFETPLDRQLHLQRLNNEKFLNTFFSLHYLNHDDNGHCFYVSEVRERSLNADFQEFSLESIKYCKNQSFTIKIWATNYENLQDWKLLMDIDINLANLLYINKSMDLINIETKNSVFLSLFDGIYLLPNENFNLAEYLTLAETSSKQLAHKRNISTIVPSFNYDLVMKLNNLQLVNDDLSRVKKKISIQIETELNKSQNIDISRVDQLQRKIKLQKESQKLMRQKLQDLKNLKKKKLYILDKQQSKKSSTLQKFETIKEEFSSLLVSNENISQELLIERAKITRIVSIIFPKDFISEWLEISIFETLPEQISQHHLTKLVNSHDPQVLEEINAGFGYVCHMIYLLSHYLAVPLKYQVRPFGSSSYVVDKISSINQRTVFPLFYTSHFHRFQYGVMLLNRNIQDISKEIYNY